MKKIVLCIIAIFLMVALTANIFAARQTPLVAADILKYEPSPADPGGILEVWISVTNQGTASEDFFIEFVPQFPFSLAQGEEEMKSLASLPQGENAVVKFRVVISPDAPSRDEYIKFMYKYSTGPAWSVLEKPITIKSTSAILTVKEYKTIPETIRPGDMVKMDITLQNSGGIGVKDIDVTLNLDESVFSPIGSGNTKRISLIPAGNSGTTSFTLIADTSAEIKVYSIPVTLKYKDLRSTEHTDTTAISLMTSSQPELAVVVDSTTISRKGQAGTVTLKAINKGIMDLKYLNMRLISTDHYDVLSASNEAYIGNLDSDDFETVDFIIKPKTKDVRLKAVIDFKDPYNKEHSTTFDLPLRVLSAAELGTAKSSWPRILLIVIIAGGIVYWYYRRRKKKNKK